MSLSLLTFPYSIYLLMCAYLPSPKNNMLRGKKLRPFYILTPVEKVSSLGQDRSAVRVLINFRMRPGDCRSLGVH